VADFQADVPEMTDQAFQFCLHRGAGFLRQQDQQVDVGSRVEFAPAIATNRSKGQRCGKVQRSPELFKYVVD